MKLVVIASWFVVVLLWTQVSTASQCGNCEWGQCGGQGYAGDSCCPDGSTCQYQNDWYSQCVPQQSPSSCTYSQVGQPCSEFCGCNTNAGEFCDTYVDNICRNYSCTPQNPCVWTGRSGPGCRTVDSTRPTGDGRYFCPLYVENSGGYICGDQRFCAPDDSCPCAGDIPCKKSVQYYKTDVYCVALNSSSGSCPDDYIDNSNPYPTQVTFQRC
eukprot:TRINITY_DN77820_c0_g1_i1.p2 TRINITY_DN77820_c0_g1~~TRINITY_DN77820_c0_g1_i1.p2  ORF type:complete len:213 (+),score=32.27 TRINITY_DN77820_c0_g1_i1:44-682(+)